MRRKLQNEFQVRKVDSLGRVTIPKALRDRFGWQQNDDINFYTWNNTFIVLSKGETRDSRYEIAVELLEELGLPVPDELKEDE